MDVENTNPATQGPITLLDERTTRHLRGACMADKGWILCWLLTYGFMFSTEIIAAKYRKLFTVYAMCCTIFSAVLVPVIAYWRIGKEKNIAFGLLVDFFWWGGLGGTTICGYLNTCNIFFFGTITPSCAIAQEKSGSDFVCQLWQIIQWCLTPGLWEELFKSGWILWRIKTKPWWVQGDGQSCNDNCQSNAVPRTWCFCCPTKDCTCWWRLAETPEAVFLCALAAGAGFEAIENIQYMLPATFRNFQQHPDEAQNAQGQNARDLALNTLYTNTFRALMILHIVWTGYIGLRFAQRFFSVPEKQPTLVSIFLPVMILHGLWDWVAFDQGKILPGWLALLSLLVMFGISLYLCFGLALKGALRENTRASVVQHEMEMSTAQQS